MPILDPKAKEQFKPAINALWTVLVVCLIVALGCEYVLKAWPSYLAWLKGILHFVILLGLIGTGVIVANRNPLVR